MINLLFIIPPDTEGYDDEIIFVILPGSTPGAVALDPEYEDEE